MKKEFAKVKVVFEKTYMIPVGSSINNQNTIDYITNLFPVDEEGVNIYSFRDCELYGSGRILSHEIIEDKILKKSPR